LPLERWFRQAAPATSRWNVAKTLAQTIVIWSLALFVIPSLIVRAEQAIGVDSFSNPFLKAAGAALFLGFSVLGLVTGNWMAVHGRGTPLPFDSPRLLVVDGPYAYVRNPMAVAGLGQGIGVALWLGSMAVLIYVAIGGLVWQLYARPAEERDLERTFGEAYRRYRDAVPCWRFRGRAYTTPQQARDRPTAPR
jgi:protein-S-isoprenylcysteine O-methyltransferase Ste14